MTNEEFYRAHTGGIRPNNQIRLKAATKTATDSGFNKFKVPDALADSSAPWQVENGRALPDSIDWN
jgi:hypothetical protein